DPSCCVRSGVDAGSCRTPDRRVSGTTAWDSGPWSRHGGGPADDGAVGPDSDGGAPRSARKLTGTFSGTVPPTAVDSRRVNSEDSKHAPVAQLDRASDF